MPKRRTTNAAEVMDRFGLGFDLDTHVIADDLQLPIQAGDVVLFTGPSGSGKSSLLRAVASRLANVVSIDPQIQDDRLLIDSLDRPATETLQHFARFGLCEPRLMLRTASELSEGERYRWRLAKAAAQEPAWVLADEFTSSLDRVTAKVLAANLRRWSATSSTGLLLATTHDDVLEDLAPELHVRCHLDGRIEVARANDSKKNGRSVSRTTFGSAKAPNAIGRTSLGGITGHRGSGWSD